MFVLRHFKRFHSPAVGSAARFSADVRAPTDKPSGFQRVIKFISTNRQQLLNVFSVHNFRMQEAWKEQEKKITEMSDELKSIRKTFENDEWYDAAAETLRGSKDLKGALKSLVQSTLAEELAKSKSNDEILSEKDLIPDLSNSLGEGSKKSTKMI